MTLLQRYIESYRGLSRPVWMLSLVMLINRTGAMVLPFLGIYMTNALGFSIKDTGTVLACFGAGAITGSLFGGWLTDRVGNFKIQVVSLALSVPMFLVLPQFTTVWQLAAGVYMLSTITETFRPANSVAMARFATPETVTRAFSLNRMAMNLGFSVGPALGGFLATISYDWIFYGNALGAALAVIVLFVSLRHSPARRESEVRVIAEDTSTGKQGSPYRDGLFVAFSVLCCIYAITFFQMFNTMPLFYQDVHHLSEPAIGILMAFNGMIVFVFEMALVHWSELQLGNRRSIVAGTTLAALGFAAFLLPGGVWTLYASMFLLSISEILAMPFMASVAIARASRMRQGAYMGMNALAFSVAHVASPFLGTRVVEWFGFSALWWGTVVVLLVATVGFGAVLRRM